MSWNRNTNERPWLVWFGNVFFQLVLFMVLCVHLELGWAGLCQLFGGFGLVCFGSLIGPTFLFSVGCVVSKYLWNGISAKNTCHVLYATLYRVSIGKFVLHDILGVSLVWVGIGGGSISSPGSGLRWTGSGIGGFGRSTWVDENRSPITLLVTAVSAAGHLHRAGWQRGLEKRHERSPSERPHGDKYRVL